MLCKANYFLHVLQSKPLFESHHCAEPHLLLLGNPSQGLFHIPELKYDFPILLQVILPGHSGSSCSFHITSKTLISVS